MDPARIKGLPVYLTHGALDWMFPVQLARDAQATLTAAGADLLYREIADLSHAYPSDENARILDWFLNAD
jgi:phospholipase/carboxylesterase